MSGLPDESRLLAAMDATWAPAEMCRLGPWTIRRGLDGGKRVSAATTDMAVTESEIDAAEAAMRELSQVPIFMLRGGNGDLDAALAARGYRVVDPVLIYVAETAGIAAIRPEPLMAIPCEEPLALMQELWAENGISAARIAVMRRTKGPKTHLFSRFRDRPAGAAFVAIDGDIAMLHALVVIPEMRRAGLAHKLMGRAAIWAEENNARYLSVVTTGENLPAQKLFASLPMQVVGKYHYRMK